MKRYILGISGASGAVLGVRLLEELIKTSEVHLVISSGAFGIIKDETGIDWGRSVTSDKKGSVTPEKAIEGRIRRHFSKGGGEKRLLYWDTGNMEAPVASGSFQTDGMFVVPCSMKTLSGIAHGYANTLIERAADVTIKESRMLLLCPREMPFSAVHLENMLKLSRLGVRIAPPVMGFYHKPEDLDSMMDFIIGKILDAAGIKHGLYKRWEGK